MTKVPDSTEAIAIIHSASQARIFLEDFRRRRDVYPIALHESAREYLVRSGRECSSAAEFETHDEIEEMHRLAESAFKTVLRQLDGEIGADLGRFVGIGRFHYFEWHYAYLGTLLAANAFRFARVLDSILGSRKLGMALYPGGAYGLSPSCDVVETIVGTSASDRELDLMCLEDAPDEIHPSRALLNLARAVRDPGFAVHRIFGGLGKRRVRIRGRRRRGPTVLLLEPLYDWEYLERNLGVRYRTDLWPYATGREGRKVSVELIEALSGRLLALEPIRDPGLDKVQNKILHELRRAAIEEFSRQAAGYLEDIFALEEYLDRNPVAVACFGVPPLWAPMSFSVNYLRARGVTIFGMQHGSGWGVQYLGMAPNDGVRARCDYFATFGGAEPEWRETYPRKDLPAVIVPVGSPKVEKRLRVLERRRRSIDLMFPITNSLHLLGESFRMKSDVLRERQNRILDWIEAHPEIRTAIKPFPLADRESCCAFDRLLRMDGRYDHVRVLWDASMESFQRRFAPRAIVIEFPSTPLYELAIEDAEIFVMLDPLCRFGATPLEILGRRAHICETLDELDQKLELWSQGRLLQRRDPEFLERYVRPSGACERLAGEVERILEM